MAPNNALKLLLFISQYFNECPVNGHDSVCCSTLTWESALRTLILWVEMNRSTSVRVCASPSALCCKARTQRPLERHSLPNQTLQLTVSTVVWSSLDMLAQLEFMHVVKSGSGSSFGLMGRLLGKVRWGKKEACLAAASLYFSWSWHVSGELAGE